MGLPLASRGETPHTAQDSPQQSYPVRNVGSAKIRKLI